MNSFLFFQAYKFKKSCLFLLISFEKFKKIIKLITFYKINNFFYKKNKKKKIYFTKGKAPIQNTRPRLAEKFAKEKLGLRKQNASGSREIRQAESLLEKSKK